MPKNMRHTIILFCIVFMSCNNNDGNGGTRNDTTNSPDTNSPEIIIENDNTTAVNETIAGCYMQVLKRDTFIAVLQQDGATISGKLTFDNFEKDGSTGDVKGTIDGDIIRLIYSFQSEGMNSVMDVYFKKQDDKLVRGIGEMSTRGDTAYFTDPSKITYPSNTMLQKVSCDLIDK